jgi:hypothetical protein
MRREPERAIVMNYSDIMQRLSTVAKDSRRAPQERRKAASAVAAVRAGEVAAARAKDAAARASEAATADVARRIARLEDEGAARRAADEKKKDEERPTIEDLVESAEKVIKDPKATKDQVAKAKKVIQSLRGLNDEEAKAMARAFGDRDPHAQLRAFRR